MRAAIVSADSFTSILEALHELAVAPSPLTDPLAIALFNQHLLARAQILADADRAGRESVSALTPHASRLMAIVLDESFAPLPFDEAIEFWRRKVNLSPDQFAALQEAARVKAFTVAGRASAQVRDSIAEMIDRAQIDGMTLREFQSLADDVAQAAGLAERTPWYWQTVYRTNLQTSYQVGRWKQMRDPLVREERPYLRYISARLPTSRASHVEKHGLVLPQDDPFWNEWYPPNGFNCYCTVVTVSESLLARRGWQVGFTQPVAFPDADEGFQTNAGAADEI